MAPWNIIDTWMVLIAICIAISSTSIGMHFVLNRESLISDAISHSVLPGIAIAFIITQNRQSFPIFIGAVISGLLATLIINFIIKQCRIDPSTSMGVVFSGFFAIGLLLISNVAQHVDLDPSCVLFGSLELTPLETFHVASFEVPNAFISNATIMLLNILFLFFLFRIMNTITFDAHFAQSIGMPIRMVRIIQMSLLTLTSVAAFESVGSILIIAFLIIPPIIGWLFSTTIKKMLFASLFAAVLSSLLGHVLAIYVPPLFGIDDVSTTGSIVAVLGMFLMLATLFSTRMGFIIISINKIKNMIMVCSYDILKMMYANKGKIFSRLRDFKELHNQSLLASRFGIFSIVLAMRFLLKKKYLDYDKDRGYIMSEEGNKKAEEILKQHRAWEEYLYAEGMDPHEIHLSAEQLEHSSEVDMLKNQQRRSSEKKIPGHSH